MKLQCSSGLPLFLFTLFFGDCRGVFLTDIIQFVFLLVSATSIFIVVFTRSGGFFEIHAAVSLMGKTDYINITAGIPKYIACVITFGGALMIQTNVWQRISATKSDLDEKK